MSQIAVRTKMDDRFTEHRVSRGSFPYECRWVWVVGRVHWWLAGRDADGGWDCEFVAAEDSPEFLTRDEARAEAERRNRPEA
jgi:hypothetical protein